MRTPHPASALLCPVFLLVAAGGCQTARPLPILVRDAETGRPIAGATVHLWYPLAQVGGGSYERSGATGDDGTIRLAAANADAGMAVVEANAAGYLLGEANVSAESLQTLKSASGSHGETAPPAGAVVDLLAEPRPTVELILPTGYKGVVKVTLRRRADVTYPPGQRCFAYATNADGEVEIVGPPILRHVTAGDYQARYADGTPIRQHAPPDQVGLYWLKGDSDDQWFVVGTEFEFGTYRVDLRIRRHDGASPATSDDGGRRGGRGGHRRGGP